MYWTIKQGLNNEIIQVSTRRNGNRLMIKVTSQNLIFLPITITWKINTIFSGTMIFFKSTSTNSRNMILNLWSKTTLVLNRLYHRKGRSRSSRGPQVIRNRPSHGKFIDDIFYVKSLHNMVYVVHTSKVHLSVVNWPKWMTVLHALRTQHLGYKEMHF